MPLASLVDRMRHGDRHAAAEFLRRCEGRIRRRIRGKLNQGMRRLFDSDEIFSTLTRRLDAYVCERRLEAVAEGEIWSLIFKMSDNALIDKARLFRRLENLQGEDSEFAQIVLRRLKAAEHDGPGGAEVEVDRALQMLPARVDREIVLCWLDGMDLASIAVSVELSYDATRKRWERIRKRLRERFEERGIQG